MSVFSGIKLGHGVQTCECGGQITRPFFVESAGRPLCCLCADVAGMATEFKAAMFINGGVTEMNFQYETLKAKSRSQRGRLLEEEDRLRRSHEKLTAVLRRLQKAPLFTGRGFAHRNFAVSDSPQFRGVLDRLNSAFQTRP